MSRPRKLPPRTLAEVVETFPAYRQSLLGKADNCALTTRFDLEGASYYTPEQARGIVFHRFAAELLRTLWRTGETKIPTEEAMVILREACRQADVPPEEVVIVPARERRLLRMAALKLADLPLNMKRMIDVERQLTATLRYTGADGNPVERVISGRPDVMLADPPNGAIVLDWKTAPSAPAEGYVPDGGGEQGHWSGDHLHVSYEGFFQQRVYAYLLMTNYASVERVTLREWYVLPGESRNATVPRAALEHIEADLADVCAFLDRALMEGSGSALWTPSPGAHCAYCRRPQACPIEADARMLKGGIVSDAEAERRANEFRVVEELRPALRKALKARHDSTGRSIPIGSSDKVRQELRWGKDSGGKRRFGVYPAPASDRGPRDPMIEAAFREAEERKAAA